MGLESPGDLNRYERDLNGRLIFIHLRCWEALPFLTIQRQRCIKSLCPKEPEFYIPLALNRQKGQHLTTPEVYKNQSPTKPQHLKIEMVFFSAGCRLDGAFPI